jgi:8-amino-7-oxononanoate synthase
MPEQLEERIRQRLAAIEGAGLERTLAPPRGVDFSSNDYLGLASHPAIKSRFSEAVGREGCGATAARLLRGDRDCFTAIESRFAAFKGTKRSLYFGSGYAANLGILGTFLEPGDVVFSDELNHASLIDGIRLAKAERRIFPHTNLDALEAQLRECKTAGQKFLVTESLFGMDGDLAPLTEYAELCRETNTNLIVDEAHAVGIYGVRGNGLIGKFGIDDEVFLSMNTAGKALGAAGAFVAGSESAIEYLVQRARTFMFSTAPPPALAAAIDASLDVIATEKDRRHRLIENISLMHELLVELGIDFPREMTQIIPIVIGNSAEAVSVASRLQVAGFDVRAVRPPTVPNGTARLRLSINSELTEVDLRSLAAAMRDVGIGGHARGAFR